MDQQFEEMNNKLNSMTDPTGFLRMVSRNNLLNRWGAAAGDVLVVGFSLNYKFRCSQLKGRASKDWSQL